MTVFVALLRGVNVGGRTSLAMADLRRIAEECGFEGVRTYIQSGNLVFRATERPAAVAERLDERLAAQTPLRHAVVLRTRDELEDVVAANPYADRNPADTHLHVVFAADPRDVALDGIDLDAYAPEHATVRGRELYLYLPNGMGRSRLAADLGRRPGAGAATSRNWRTVTKLVTMARELAPGAG